MPARSRLAWLLSILMCLAAFCSPAQAEEALKAGFLYIGPSWELGWSYAHDQGRKAVEARFGNKLKTSFVENVPDTPDAERVIRNLAAEGKQVIFATSFGHMDAVEKVSREFPKTIFMHATGYKTGKNLGVYDIRTYEGAYLLGVVAGKMSKSGQLGMIASIPIPEVIRNINAFTIGARSVNPKARTRVIWVNTWFSPPKEREAALALVAQGADVLMQNTDSTAVGQVAREKGVYAFGWDADMSKFSDKAQLAASVLDWGVIYAEQIEKIQKGQWQSCDLWYGLKEGALDIKAFGPATPAEVRILAQARRDAIKEGSLHPFTGPLRDNTGKLLVPAGKWMSDTELRAMRSYVEGVDAKTPELGIRR